MANKALEQRRKVFTEWLGITDKLREQVKDFPEYLERAETCHKNVRSLLAYRGPVPYMGILRDVRREVNLIRICHRSKTKTLERVASRAEAKKVNTTT
jgi:hypothetical protein